MNSRSINGDTLSALEHILTYERAPRISIKLSYVNRFERIYGTAARQGRLIESRQTIGAHLCLFFGWLR